MKNLFAFAFIACIAITQVSAQKYFTKYYPIGTGDDRGHSVIETKDGKFLIAGMTNSQGAGNYDMFLMKVDLTGNVEWFKTYGGTAEDGNHISEGVHLIETRDSGFVAVGYSNSFGLTSFGAYIIKVNKNGILQWDNLYNNSGTDFARGVFETETGELIVYGSINSQIIGKSDAFVLKLSSSGVVKWKKNYGKGDNDHFSAGILGSDNNYIFGNGTQSYGPGTRAIMMIKTDTSGNIIWQNTYGGSSQDELYDIKATPDNGLIVTGPSLSFGVGGYSYLVVKLDSNQNVQWSKAYGGSQDDHPRSILVLNDGYLIGGFIKSYGAGGIDILWMKIDLVGNIVWAKTFGKQLNDEIRTQKNMLISSDTSLVLTGYSQFTGQTNNDPFLFKVDIDGSDLCINALVATHTAVVTKTTPNFSIASGGSIINPNTIVNTPTILGVDNCICNATPPFASATKYSICFGESTQLMVTGGQTYDWVPSFGLSCTNCSNPIASPDSTTTYKVYIDAKSTCPFEDSVTITVLRKTEIDLGPDTSICYLGSLLLDAGSGFNSYLWSNGNTSSTSTFQAPVGSYTVHVTAINPGGCVSTDTIKITVTPCDFVNDPKNIQFIKVFPNPFSNYFTIQSEKVCEIEIFDLTGKLVYKKAIDMPGMHSIKFDSFYSGVYILKAMQENGYSFQRIVKF